MAKLELTFKKERETKHAIPCREVSVPGKALVVGTVQIQKWLAPLDTIKITLEW
jgi:hypothetical protein